MNKLIANYRDLYDSGKTQDAERYLTDYLHSVNISDKAHFMADIFRGGIEGVFAGGDSESITQLKDPLTDHLGRPVDDFDEGRRARIKDDIYSVGNIFVYHRGNLGDAHIVHVWRNNELIYTWGHLIEAYKLNLFYDKNDDIVFICFFSDREIDEGEGKDIKVVGVTNVIAIEDPSQKAVCSRFEF